MSYGKRLGHDLMKPTDELFALWKKVRDGTLSRRSFAARCNRSASAWTPFCCAVTTTS